MTLQGKYPVLLPEIQTEQASEISFLFIKTKVKIQRNFSMTLDHYHKRLEHYKCQNAD
jgi:hypothetical protein